VGSLKVVPHFYAKFELIIYPVILEKLLLFILRSYQRTKIKRLSFLFVAGDYIHVGYKEIYNG